MTPPYDTALLSDEYLSKKSMDVFVKKPRNTIKIHPGIKPTIVIVDGRPIMPAPTIVVERLKIAL